MPDSNINLVATISNKFSIGSIGKLITNSSDVIAGIGSIYGSYSGINQYSVYLSTDPIQTSLLSNQKYTVTFDYKILSPNDKGFECIIYSPTQGKSGVYLPSARFSGDIGTTGSITLTNTLGNYSDYRVNWNIVGNGAVAIDNIKISNSNTGELIAFESVENLIQSYKFTKNRDEYLLNVTKDGTDVIDKASNSHVFVPYDFAMDFNGHIKYSKNSLYIVHNIESHVEAYTNINSLVNLPVNFIRTGIDAINKHNYDFNYYSLDVPKKVIVGYVGLAEFGNPGGWDPSFRPEWDMNNDNIIDSGTKNLPDYVDLRVYNAPWQNYVAKYWTDSWKDQLKNKIDIAAHSGLDGVMLDVMTAAKSWKEAYPQLEIKDLQLKMADLIKWISTYSKSTYGSAFIVSVNFDSSAFDYFPDMGKYVDAGYYQNAFFHWDGNAEINPINSNALKFIKDQGIQLLNMDHLGTGNSPGGLNFINYDNLITKENILKLFVWCISYDSTPFSAPVFFGTPYEKLPHFVRIIGEKSDLTNTDYNDWVIGNNLNKVILTGNGNDVIAPILGVNEINAGAGIDSIIYLDLRKNHSLTQSNGNWTISSNVNSTDQLSNVERIIFSDTNVAIDISGNAGTTAKILGAVFGKEAVNNKNYVGIGLHFLDNGWSYDNLAGLALDAAGAKTNDQIVSLLWTNVIGTKPSATDKAPFIALLEQGMTAGALAHLAADTAFNITNINLVGLAQTGIEFIPV